MKHLIQEQRKEIARLYESERISLSELARRLKMDRSTITRWVRRENLRIRIDGKFRINSTIFTNIDSEEKAYWLGFLFADGYISDENRFELSLGLKDINHLEKFKNFLNWEGDIKIDNKVGRCRLSFKDEIIGENLKLLGLIPRKSTILEFPTLTEESIPHFIRGYFDGDGTITDPDKTSILVNLIGTENFLTFILTYCNLLQITPKLKHPNQSQLIFNFNLCGKNARDFMKFLYKDATIFLDRKKERFDKHLCNCVKRPNCKE